MMRARAKIRLEKCVNGEIRRLKKGISLSYLKSILPFELNELKIGKLIEENVVISGQNIISLTEKGFNISDNAIYELIESIEFKYD